MNCHRSLPPLLLPLLLLLLLLSVHPASARPSSDHSLVSALRAHGSGSQPWGLKVEDEDAMEETLSRFNSPYIKFLMKDQLFLQHLQHFLKRQDYNSFNQLRNRVKTIARRRSDDVSTRFFLRD